MDYINKLVRPADLEIAQIIEREQTRQYENLELIASENIVSEAVMAAMGCVLTNKYAEGYPGKRYYGGCEFADEAERLAQERAKKLFGGEHVNVQPHSGAQANMAVYFAALKPGDAVLGMKLSHGGHLTHGSPVNMSGAYYNFTEYELDRETERIDYEGILRMAKQHRPKMIVAGASAYPRILDFQRFRQIADAVGALLMVDMAHIAGLVAAGLHPSPVEYAHFVTTTTHKTLRGPRGGLIICREEYAKAIDKAVFPGIQGGPLMHIIAAKVVALGEAMRPQFVIYQRKILSNARVLAVALQKRGFRLVSGGTDNHIILIDLRNKGLTGKEAEGLLDDAGISVNKNTIPYETESPFVTSGIRIGTPAVTTRGMGAAEMEMIAELISAALIPGNTAETKTRVRELTAKFPLFFHDQEE